MASESQQANGASAQTGGAKRNIPPIRVSEGYDTDGDLDGFVTCDEGAAQLVYAAMHSSNFDTDSATDYDDFESPDSVGGKKFFIAGSGTEGSVSSTSTANSTASNTPTSSASNSMPNSPVGKPTAPTAKFHLLASPPPPKSLPKILEGASSGDESTSAMQDSDAYSSPELPLSASFPQPQAAVPNPWKQYFDDEGNPYWYNEQTNESSWYLPKDVKLASVAEEEDASKASSSAADSGVAPGTPSESSGNRGTISSAAVLANDSTTPNVTRELFPLGKPRESATSATTGVAVATSPSPVRRVPQATAAAPAAASPARLPPDRALSPSKNIVLLRDSAGDIWERHLEASSKSVFYFHRRSELSQWDEPPGLIPVSVASKEQLVREQQRMKDQQKSTLAQRTTPQQAQRATPQQAQRATPQVTHQAAAMEPQPHAGAAARVAAPETSPSFIGAPTSAHVDYLTSAKAVLQRMSALQTDLAVHEAIAQKFAAQLQQQRHEQQQDEQKSAAQQRGLQSRILELQAQHAQETEALKNEFERRLAAQVAAARREASEMAAKQIADVKLASQIAEQKLHRQLGFERAELGRVREQLQLAGDEVAALDVRLAAAQQNAEAARASATESAKARESAAAEVHRLREELAAEKAKSATLQQKLLRMQVRASPSRSPRPTPPPGRPQQRGGPTVAAPPSPSTNALVAQPTQEAEASPVTGNPNFSGPASPHKDSESQSESRSRVVDNVSPDRNATTSGHSGVIESDESNVDISPMKAHPTQTANTSTSLPNATSSPHAVGAGSSPTTQHKPRPPTTPRPDTAEAAGVAATANNDSAQSQSDANGDGDSYEEKQTSPREASDGSRSKLGVNFVEVTVVEMDRSTRQADDAEIVSGDSVPTPPASRSGVDAHAESALPVDAGEAPPPQLEV